MTALPIVETQCVDSSDEHIRRIGMVLHLALSQAGYGLYNSDALVAGPIPAGVGCGSFTRLLLLDVLDEQVFLAASLLVYSPSEGRAVNWHWLVLRMMYPHDWLFSALATKLWQRRKAVMSTPALQAPS